MLTLKNTEDVAPTNKINLCGRLTHPTAACINKDPWEQKLLFAIFHEYIT